MGCDIHAYIEYEEFMTREDTPWMSCFAENIDIGRNYELFALMAGVRYDALRADYKPLFEPRGISEPMSFQIKDRYTLFVSDEDYDSYVKPRQAEKWVTSGSSKWWDEKHTRITHPDWHSASWLYVDELEQVQEVYASIQMADSSWYQPKEQGVPEGAKIVDSDKSNWIYVEVGERKPMGKYMPLEAVIAAMKVINGNNPKRSRLVFWFDS